MNTPDANELKRQQPINQKQQKKSSHKKRSNKRKKLLQLLVRTVIIYVFLLLAIIFFLSISLKSCNKSTPKHNISVVQSEDNKITLNKKDLYFNDVLYLPLSALEHLTEIMVTGDNNKLSFIFEHNQEFAKFELNTMRAEINSNYVTLSHNSLMVDGELYFPFDFFKNQMMGFDITENEKNNTYTITANPDVEPQFILKAPVGTPSIDESSASDITNAPLSFVLDLSSYEEYMNPSDRDAFLSLVNKNSPIDRDYVPDHLTGCIYTRNDRDTRMLSKYACLALEAFLKEGEANGVKGVTVTSAYRSYEYQEELFNQEVLATGSEEEAAKNVNPPGTSEHQTGLAVDMHNMESASQAFGETGAYRWLRDNAHKFGYILRYPKDKTKITGINFEPWHFRYVGRYHATKMHELDMCLEEYIDYINQ